MLPACTTCGELGHTDENCGNCVARPQDVAALSPDFDESGRRLLARMDALTVSAEQECTRSQSCSCPLCDRKSSVAALVRGADAHAPLHEIWRAPDGPGKVYVGGLQAASNAQTLRAHGITHVVNCMNRPSLNKHAVEYFDFPIESWRGAVAYATDTAHDTASAFSHAFTLHGLSARGAPAPTPEAIAAVRDFFAQPMEFVRDATERGSNVLIHCFAGAHRAGTTGVAWLMHQERLSAAGALQVAQRCRPVIDPKCHPELWALLQMLEAAAAEKEVAEETRQADYAKAVRLLDDLIAKSGGPSLEISEKAWRRAAAAARIGRSVAAQVLKDADEGDMIMLWDGNIQRIGDLNGLPEQDEQDDRLGTTTRKWMRDNAHAPAHE